MKRPVMTAAVLLTLATTAMAQSPNITWIDETHFTSDIKVIGVSDTEGNIFYVPDERFSEENQAVQSIESAEPDSVMLPMLEICDFNWGLDGWYTYFPSISLYLIPSDFTAYSTLNNAWEPQEWDFMPSLGSTLGGANFGTTLHVYMNTGTNNHTESAAIGQFWIQKVYPYREAYHYATVLMPANANGITVHYTYMQDCQGYYISTGNSNSGFYPDHIYDCWNQNCLNYHFNYTPKPPIFSQEEWVDELRHPAFPCCPKCGSTNVIEWNP